MRAPWGWSAGSARPPGGGSTHCRPASGLWGLPLEKELSELAYRACGAAAGGPVEDVPPQLTPASPGMHTCTCVWGRGSGLVHLGPSFWAWEGLMWKEAAHPGPAPSSPEPHPRS